MSKKQIVSIDGSAFDHPDFELELDANIPQGDISALADFLRDSLKDGVRFNVGETIEFGMMLLRIEKLNRALTLQEPDLRGIPINWTFGATNSLRIMRLQRDVGDSVGLREELQFPSIRSSLLRGVDVEPGRHVLFLNRSQFDGLDSGWFVGLLSSDTDYENPANLQRESVYQAMLWWPNIIGFLALPFGCRIELTEHSIDIYRGDKKLTAKAGSLLYNLC